MTDPTPLSAEEVERLRELLAQATCAPWFVSQNHLGDWDVCFGVEGDPQGTYTLARIEGGTMLEVDPECRADADLIAAMHSALPRLLSDLTRLRTDLEAERARVRWFVEHAADEKLDGYRELGQRAADAENERGRLRTERDAAVGRAEQLEEALRPFAEFTQRFMLTSEDFDRARALLEKGKTL